MNFEHLIDLEKVLLKKSVRKDPLLLKKYLSADFVEFGASGKVYSLQDILTRLPAEDGVEDIEASMFKLTPINEDWVLMNYESKRTDSDGFSIRTLRTSVWRKEGSDWRIFFHQGTKKI